MRDKATLFLLAFLAKERTFGLILSDEVPSIFLGARCE
jgi:hypothetical protein